MATEGGGKMKSKRQASDSRPYSRRQSLIGRVTNTVKDMLSPSWVIDLVNGVKKSPKQFDHDDLEPQQQEPDGEIPVRRELNRMSTEDNMLSSSTPNTQQVHAPPQPSAPSNPMSFSAPQQMPPYSSYRPPAPVPQHVLTNGDDQSDASDYSVATSACSSLIPHPDRKDYQGEVLQMNDSHLRQMHQHMDMRGMPSSHNASTDVTNTSTSSAMEGSFLWSSTKTKPSKPQQPAKSQTPSFKTSLLSPSKPMGAGYHQSPYYPGKTTFGGAAAYRKSRIKQSTMPYEPSPTRKQVQARPLNNSSLGGVTSSTAKRILDTLEKMSTPLSDAKKIPLDGNLSDSMISLTPGTYRRRRTPNTSLSQSMTEGPPTSKRPLSSFASIATNLHPAPTTEPVPRGDANGGQSNQTRPPTEPSYQAGTSDRGGGRGGKMKRDRGSHYSSKQTEDEEVEVVDLPTSFVLPVANFTLPSLGFGLNTQASSAADTKTVGSAATSGAATTSATSSPASPAFSFASPIVKSSSADTNAPVVNTQFQFSSPIAVDKPTSQNAGSPPTTGFTYTSSAVAPKMKPPAVNFNMPGETDTGGGFKPAAELKSGSVMDILSKSKPAELKSGSVMDVLGKPKPTPNGNVGGLQPAATLKTGSVMDILGKSSSSKPETSSGLTGLFGKSAGEWTCDTCLIKNKADVGNCVACETSKPRLARPPISTKSPAEKCSSLSGIFKQASGDWTCDTCLINNKAEKTKCVACETPKPRPKPASTPSSSMASTNSGLAHLKKTGGDWTCDTCLIQNKSDASKCVACETPKPRSSAAPPTTSTSGSGLSNMFKKPDGDWTCDICLVQNKADKSKCAACETPRPGAKIETSKPAETSSLLQNTQTGVKPFQFGNFAKKSAGWECDTCLVANKAEANKCVACEMPKPGAKPPTGFTSTGGFSFGVGGFGSSTSTSTTASTPTTGFSFGNTAVSASASSTKDELPTTGFKPPSGAIAFGKPKNEEEKKSDVAVGGFQFGAGAGSTAPKPKKAASPAAAAAKPAFGGFQFGQSESAGSDDKKTESQAYGGFKFGDAKPASPKKPEEAPKPSGGFQFGQPAKTETTEAKPAAPGGGFSFGKAAETAPADKSNTASAASSLFQFGQPLSTNANTVETKALGAGGTGGFQFSAAPAATQEKKDTTPAPLFQFSAKPADATPKDSPALFGVSKPSESKSVFGAPASTDKPAVSTGGFQFGATSAAPPASGGFAFGTNGNSSKPEEKPTAAVPVFTFGGGATENKVSTGQSFAFGATKANKPAESSGLGTGGFSFNKPATAATSNTSPGKRGRDDMENGSDAKKANFSFSAAQPGAPSSTGTSGFAFGQNSTTAFGAGKSTTNSTPGGFGGFGSASQAPTNSVFGAPTPQTGAVFGNSTAPSTNAFGSPAPAFGAPTTTTGQTGGLNMSTPASFNFGSASGSAPASGLFQFSANSNNQSNTAASAGGTGGANFAFGQGGAPTQPTAPAAAPAPAFNSTPSFNFAGSAAATQPGVFNFSAAGNPAGAPAAPAANNPFSATGGSANANNARRFKKAVRKLRK